MRDDRDESRSRPRPIYLGSINQSINQSFISHNNMR